MREREKMISTTDIVTPEDAREKISMLRTENKTTLDHIIIQIIKNAKELQDKKKMNSHDANVLIGLNIMLKEAYVMYDEQTAMPQMENQEEEYARTSETSTVGQAFESWFDRIYKMPPMDVKGTTWFGLDEEDKNVGPFKNSDWNTEFEGDPDADDKFTHRDENGYGFGLADEDDEDKDEWDDVDEEED